MGTERVHIVSFSLALSLPLSRSQRDQQSHPQQRQRPQQPSTWLAGCARRTLNARLLDLVSGTARTVRPLLARMP
eukprot:2177031-Alexandrium_andersonii.AAC.1